MSLDGSVTIWLEQLKAGQRATVEKLWERYFHRLVGLARKKLQGQVGPAIGAEDVALSAFDSFCRAAEQNRFPRLSDRDDLWQVLMLLTRRKAIDAIEYEHREIRDVGRVRQISALNVEDGSSASQFVDLIDREPEPAFLVQVMEECQRLLQKLESDDMRQLAVWKMEGYTNEEIARQIDRSVGTVERKLKLIRDIWQEDAP